MELIIYIALGIVLGFALLSFLDDLLVGVVKLIGYAVVLVCLLGAVWFLGELFSGVYQTFVESPWTIVIVVLAFIGVVVFASTIFISARRRVERNEKRFREVCSKETLKDLFGDCLVTSGLDLTLVDRASEVFQCPYQLQVRLYHHWIAVDGGESYKLIEAKAKRLNDAAYAGEISNEVQGARIVAFDQDRQEKTRKEFHFPDKWRVVDRFGK